MAKAYEQVIKEIAVYVREELKHIDEIHTLNFSIDISGRLHDGELKIKFEIGSTYGAGGSVKGGNIEDVLVEYMRRFGWDKRNQPLELSFAPEMPPVRPSLTDDEIPF